MAKMIFDSNLGRELGPYPAHAGDFCGNRLPGRERAHSLGDDANYWAGAQTQYREGNPHPCNGKSSAELRAEGVVGLYLLHDAKLMPWERPIPTPPELSEPV